MLLLLRRFVDLISFVDLVILVIWTYIFTRRSLPCSTARSFLSHSYKSLMIRITYMQAAHFIYQNQKLQTSF